MLSWLFRSKTSRNGSPDSQPWQGPLAEEPPPKDRRTPSQEAEDTLLDKGSKLELARQAVFLQNLQEIAYDDVKDVRRLKSKHLGPEFAMNEKGGKSGESVDDMGIIVCDDFHHHHDNNNPSNIPPNSQPSRWPIALGISVAGMAIAAGLAVPQMLARHGAQEERAVQPADGKNTTTTIKRGFIIDLPGSK